MNEDRPKPLAAIFDMDGVLLDSPALNWQAMNNVLANYDVQIPTTQIEKYLGRTLKDQVAQFNEDFGLHLDYEEFKGATAAIKQQLFAHIQPKEGVLELLQSLKANGVPRAVATSMPRDLTEQRLRTAGILGYFDAVITEDDVTRHKPDPEVFEKAANALGVVASNCVVFEDAPSGVQATKTAGMKSVAIETTFVDKEKLSQADIIALSMLNVSLADLERLVSS